MRSLSLIVLLALLPLTGACGGEREVDPRGIGEPARPLSRTYNSNPDDPLVPPSHDLNRIPVGMGATRPVLERRVAPTAPEAPEEALPERDWEGEIRGAIGAVSSCLDPSEELPERVTLRVQAFVTSTGRVSRGYVSSTSLPSTATACLRARIEAAHFAPPSEPGGKNVRAVIRFTRQTSE